jgi:hypothetical protein
MTRDAVLTPPSPEPSKLVIVELVVVGERGVVMLRLQRTSPR